MSEDGRCHQAGLQADCPPGQVLQQSNLPPGCDCLAWRDCPTFTRDAVLLTNTRREDSLAQYRLGVARLAALVCDKQQQRVCCQSSQTLGERVDLASVMTSLTRHYQRELACAPNTCPPAHIPWPDRPGRCFHTETGRARSVGGLWAGPSLPLSNIYIATVQGSCRLSLAEDTELVVCEAEGSLAVRNVPGAYSSKCGRGRIWSRYRSVCVGLFF